MVFLVNKVFLENTHSVWLECRVHRGGETVRVILQNTSWAMLRAWDFGTMTRSSGIVKRRATTFPFIDIIASMTKTAYRHGRRNLNPKGLVRHAD